MNEKEDGMKRLNRECEMNATALSTIPNELTASAHHLLPDGFL